MKKIVVWLLALVCAFGMAGCKPVIIDKETDGDYEVNIDLDQNTEGTLSILVPSTDGGRESDIIDVLAKGFKAIYPNVTVVKHADMITDEMYMDTIGTLVQSESMPDLVYTNTAMYYYLVSKKVVVNLEPYFKATEEAGTLDMADYYSEYFNMATFEGKRYIWNINAEFGNHIICRYSTKMSKPKSNVVQMTPINNQSYVNCQGAPTAKMQPGIFCIHV